MRARVTIEYDVPEGDHVALHEREVAQMGKVPDLACSALGSRESRTA